MVFIYASARGTLVILQFDHFARKLTRLDIDAEKFKICNNGFALSLDIATAVNGNSSNCVVSFALSTGEVAVLDVLSEEASSSSSSSSNQEEEKIDFSCCWKAHDYETWCVAWDRSNSSETATTTTLFSGGDDCKLKMWDLRTNPTSTSSFQFQKSRDMGVTCLAPHPRVPFLLAYGCYDEHVTMCDTRMFSKAIDSLRMDGGGIWRLRWHPIQNELLGTAAMHAGAAILNWDMNSLSVIARHTQHESMAYGIDWISWIPDVVDKYDSSHEQLPAAAMTHTLATCSFYDKSLHVWEN